MSDLCTWIVICRGCKSTDGSHFHLLFQILCINYDSASQSCLNNIFNLFVYLSWFNYLNQWLLKGITVTLQQTEHNLFMSSCLRTKSWNNLLQGRLFISPRIFGFYTNIFLPQNKILFSLWRYSLHRTGPYDLIFNGKSISGDYSLKGQMNEGKSME